MPAPNLSIWRKLFRKADLATDLAEYVIEEQAYWERHHPVAYAPDQRLTALVQRAAQTHGGAPPAACQKILADAVADWSAASTVAEATP